MNQKVLILHIPVIHKGFLDLLEKFKKEVSEIYVIKEEMLEELSEKKPTIESLSSRMTKELLEKFGFGDVTILSKENVGELEGKEIILIQDEVSRKMAELYFSKNRIEWESAFLRWDKDKILAEIPKDIIEKSEDDFDVQTIKEAYKEAEKSGDWWRQIGAVLIKDGKIVARSYNQGTPDDNTPYQLGSMRDFFKAGEKQEFSPTIHAEQKMIAEAAKVGLKLDGGTLYLTHFPCPLCSKLIAWSGIKKLYFTEGASNLDGKGVMESAGIEIVHVDLTRK
ncbi:MAG: deaminase [Candidatus Nealsonbacteria bacterium]